jgi:hypothetical protein
VDTYRHIGPHVAYLPIEIVVSAKRTPGHRRFRRKDRRLNTAFRLTR